MTEMPAWKSMDEMLDAEADAIADARGEKFVEYYAIYYVDSRGIWRADNCRFGSVSGARLSIDHMADWVIVKRKERIVSRGDGDKSSEMEIWFKGCERARDNSTPSRTPRQEDKGQCQP